MQPAQVTVLLQAGGDAEALQGAIESALRQVEVPLVLRLLARDDTPGLEALCTRFGGDRRFAVSGVEAAAPEVIGTPWVALLEAPDRWASSYLASQFERLEADPEAAGVIAGCRYVGAGQALYATSFDRPDWQTPDSLERLCAGAFAHPSSVVLRSEVLAARPLDLSAPPGAWLDWLFQLALAGHRLIENRHTLVDHGSRGDVDPEGEALARDEVRARYADRCDTCRRDPFDLVRRHARYLARTRQWRASRPYFWRWWKHKPDSTQALWGLLRSLLARR